MAEKAKYLVINCRNSRSQSLKVLKELNVLMYNLLKSLKMLKKNGSQYCDLWVFTLKTGSDLHFWSFLQHKPENVFQLGTNRQRKDMCPEFNRFLKTILHRLVDSERLFGSNLPQNVCSCNKLILSGCWSTISVSQTQLLVQGCFLQQACWVQDWHDSQINDIFWFYPKQHRKH